MMVVILNRMIVTYCLIYFNFRYNYKLGLIPFEQSLPSFPTYFIPTLSNSKNITISLLSSIVYKSGSMYNRSEYMHFVDMNEMHKFIHQQKLKPTMFNPVIKTKKFMSTISLPDLKTSIGDMFSGFSTWWSYFYWFAVIVSVIFVSYLFLKCICLCNKMISRRYIY